MSTGRVRSSSRDTRTSAFPVVAISGLLAKAGGEAFGQLPDGREVESYMLGTEDGLHAEVLTLGGTLRYHPEEWPLGLQFDGQYMTHARDVDNTVDGGLDIIGGSVSAVFSFYPETSSFVPYMLIGGGAFNLKAQNPRSLPDSLVYGSQTKAGVVFGGGFEYRTFTARLVPYIDLRLIGILGSDPREGAFITFTGGLKYVLGGEKPR